MSEGLSRSEQLRRRIIIDLRGTIGAWGGDGSSWKSFATLAKRLHVPVRCVKREVRRLCRSGVLRYTQLFDNDGRLAGAGYLLCPDWEKHQPGREGDPES